MSAAMNYFLQCRTVTLVDNWLTPILSLELQCSGAPCRVLTTESSTSPLGHPEFSTRWLASSPGELRLRLANRAEDEMCFIEIKRLQHKGATAGWQGDRINSVSVLGPGEAMWVRRDRSTGRSMVVQPLVGKDGELGREECVGRSRFSLRVVPTAKWPWGNPDWRHCFWMITGPARPRDDSSDDGDGESCSTSESWESIDEDEPDEEEPDEEDSEAASETSSDMDDLPELVDPAFAPREDPLEDPVEDPTPSGIGPEASNEDAEGQDPIDSHVDLAPAVGGLPPVGDTPAIVDPPAVLAVDGDLPSTDDAPTVVDPVSQNGTPADPAPSIMVLLKRLAGEDDIAVHVAPTATVQLLKAAVGEKALLSPDLLVLTLPDGKVLKEGSLTSHGIKNLSEVMLLVRKEPESDNMQIFVKDLGNKTVTVDVTGTTTIADVQEMLQARLGVAAEDMRLVFAGKQMDSNQTLADYNIKKESTLQMVLKLRGGGGCYDLPGEEGVALQTAVQRSVGWVDPELGALVATVVVPGELRREPRTGTLSLSVLDQQAAPLLYFEVLLQPSSCAGEAEDGKDATE